MTGRPLLSSQRRQAPILLIMSIRLHAVTLDAREPAALARFWARVLGGTTREAGNGYIAVERVPGLAGRLLIQPVTDERVGKNPIHLDLTAEDVAGELARLVDLGAVVVDERTDSEFHWWVLADPAGNLFCLG